MGATEKIQLDIIILAATNRDLKAMVDAGEFRKDLYYRLFNHLIINPPLRDHLEDIPILVAHFVKEFNLKYNSTFANLSFACLFVTPDLIRGPEKPLKSIFLDTGFRRYDGKNRRKIKYAKVEN